MLMAPVLGYLVVANSFTLACIVFVIAGVTDLVSVFYKIFLFVIIHYIEQSTSVYIRTAFV